MQTKPSTLLMALMGILLLSPLALNAQDLMEGFKLHLDTSSDEFVYYNLSENREVTAQEASFGSWDVAFQGTTVKFNGPSQLVAQSFETVVVALDDGYATSEDGTSELPTDAESRWFNYDFNTHFISAKPDRTAIFKTKDGHWGKLNITDYYKTVFGQDPIPRMLSFRWSVQKDGSTALK